MKALTANRLTDGEVVFWKSGQWVTRFADAELWADDDPAALEAEGGAVIEALQHAHGAARSTGRVNLIKRK